MRSRAAGLDDIGDRMSNAVLGIDVSKETLDVACARGQRKQSKTFPNSPGGWRQIVAWLKSMGVEQAHICLEATGHYGRDLAVALHEAGHVVSIVNPAQIRHFARTRLGRNKTDKVDAALIREYAEIFKPAPWSPPSPALRRLSELQTIRAGLVGNLTEWRNRKGSGLADPIAQALAEATIHHLAAQLAAVDNAIAETIDQDADLCRKRDLLLSISGVGEILTGLLLTEMPGPEVLRRGAEVSAYAGLNPSHHQSGKSINRPSRISKIGNAVLRSALYMPALAAMRSNPAVAALAQRLRKQGRLTARQIVVAAMRKLLVLCFGVLKSGQPFDPSIAMPA